MINNDLLVIRVGSSAEEDLDWIEGLRKMCYSERHWGPGCVLLDPGREDSHRKWPPVSVWYYRLCFGFYDYMILSEEQELWDSIGWGPFDKLEWEHLQNQARLLTEEGFEIVTSGSGNQG